MLKNQLKDFLYFIRTQGIAGLAIGFILGKAVSDLVGSLVNDIINPLIGLLISGKFGDLTNAAFHIGTTTVSYGKFIALLINFFIIAAVVYFGINKFLLRADKSKEEKPVIK